MKPIEPSGRGAEGSYPPDVPIEQQSEAELRHTIHLRDLRIETLEGRLFRVTEALKSKDRELDLAKIELNTLRARTSTTRLRTA
jgi:hypothetical protein